MSKNPDCPFLCANCNEISYTSCPTYLQLSGMSSPFDQDDDDDDD